MDEDQLETTVSENELEQYAARTRNSLIARLDNWDDQKTWDDFYKTYWKLIYSVAIKANLRQDEAWDVVQETILSIAKQSKKHMYDPAQGSFKSWLWNITRWRINDQFRKRKKDTALVQKDFENKSQQEDWIDKVVDDRPTEFDKIWDTEWQNNLLHAALAKVKAKVTPQQFQIFDYYVLRDWSATKVARHLDVSLAQVYLTKHRVGSTLKKELQALKELSQE